MFCLYVKTSCLPVESINETPGCGGNPGEEGVLETGKEMMGSRSSKRAELSIVKCVKVVNPYSPPLT